MKKKIWLAGAAAFLAAALTFPAFAGQWRNDPARSANQGGVSNWWYQNDDGSYPAGRWEWIDGNGDGTAECYYFDPAGWMYASTKTPDAGFQVNENGAWTENGVIRTKKVAPQTAGTPSGGQTSADHVEQGWRYSADGGKMYYSSTDRYVTGWKKIDGKKYYFDETGYMLTGYQELEDGDYYFYEDGHMAENYVHTDGVYYVMDEDDRVIDEVDEDEWADYRRESGISSSADDLKGKTYDYDEGFSAEMALDCIDLINAERKKAKREPLEIDETLMEAAEIRAGELEEKYSHTRPDGTDWKTVYDEVGYSDYNYWGENIAMGQQTPEIVTKAWMNSSGHKKNILSKNYTRIGLGCYVDGSGRTYWSNEFSN